MPSIPQLETPKLQATRPGRISMKRMNNNKTMDNSSNNQVHINIMLLVVTINSSNKYCSKIT